MRRTIRLALSAVAVACLAPLAASGQSPENAADHAVPLLVDRPLTLPRSVAQISVPLGVSLSTGSGGEPTFLNPSIAYGVTDLFTVGIRHFLGLCFTDVDGGCPKFYNDLGLDALYSLVRGGRLEIAAGASLNIAPIGDPNTVSGEVRVPIKFGGGQLALVLSPTLNFGLNERDDGLKRYGVAFNAGSYDIVIPAEVQPNEEVLRIPLTFQLQLKRGPVLLAGASVDGALDPPVGSFSDVYRIPVMFGLVFAPIEYLDLGAALTFPDLLGQDATADDRFLSAFATLRI